MLDQWSGSFDWDAGNWPKCGRHGVPRADIEATFAGDPLIVLDLVHSTAEPRFIAIGLDQRPRPVLVVFTMRGGPELLVRPISARYMHLDEVEYYAETVARIEDG